MDRTESYKGRFEHATSCEATDSSCIRELTLERALDTVKGVTVSHGERGGVRRSARGSWPDRRRHLRPLSSLVLADRLLQSSIGRRDQRCSWSGKEKAYE